MAAKQLPDVETLRKLLDYDPETGILTWKARPVEMFSKAGIGREWNNRYAGKAAGNEIGYQKGYLAFTALGSHLLAHRVAWALHYSEWPADHMDHINGNKADNRIENLRVVTVRENCMNRPRRKDNSSGHTGVYWVANENRWMAQIKAGGRQKTIGRYLEKEDAIAARKDAEAAYGYHPNHGR